jgi:DNA-binding response OmpR family regulator
MRKVASLPLTNHSSPVRELRPESRPLVAIVISTETEIAAILRQLLTHDGYQVWSEEGSEPLDAVLERVRPRLVLVDVDHLEAFSSGFIKRARGIGAAVVAFSPGRHEGEVRVLAATHGLAAFGLPLRISQFRDTLRAALLVP